MTGESLAAFLRLLLTFGLALLVVTLVVVRLGLVAPRLARGMAGISLTFVLYGALNAVFGGLGERAVDATLYRAEVAMFGTTLVELVEPLTAEWLTLLMGLIYSIHVPLFFVPALLHWRAGRYQRADGLLVTLALAMYIGFVGYVLLPAYGPVGYFTHLRPLGTNPITLGVAEYGVAIGTFPSLHAGISAAVAIDGWRTSRRWGVVLTIVATLIWISTIYLRYHWVPDLLAGLALAALCTWMGTRIVRAERRMAVARLVRASLARRPTLTPSSEHPG